MKNVSFGKTGLMTSHVGLGGIPIQRVDLKSVTALMDAAEQAGIHYIDTARAYTVSEEFLGKALEGRRDHFILASKSMARTKEAMAADIETSLKNLRTSWIDLYQIHNPTLSQLETVLAPGGALEALVEARQQGKIRHIGLTAHSIDVFARGIELPWVESIMFPYNIVETQGEKWIHRCREKGIAFIAMKPLAGGAIEDAELAMRFVCANPDVTVVIPGMFAPEEVVQNVASASRTEEITAEEWAKIEKIRENLGEQFCRRCNYCAPCTVGIQIPSVFLFSGYLERYGLEKWARERYASLSVKASACVGCGLCETRCPYHLPIREMLKKCAAEFDS